MAARSPARSHTPAENAPAAAARAAKRSARLPPLLWSLAPALAALALYLLLTPAVSGDKDGGEFTLVLAFNGAAHPTGYPIYTLLGHLFVTLLHALGATWAWAANAWSGVGGALAICFLHRLAVRLIPAQAPLGRAGRFALGLLPVALFGLDPIWTYETTLAEVYSWHLAWVAGAGLLFVHLLGAWSGPQRWSGRRRALWAAAWGATCGLGGAHHVTALFVAAPLSLALFWFGRRRQQVGAREALLVLLAALVPLASYGWLAYRALHPAVWQWPTLQPGWKGLWAHVSGAAYQGNLGHFRPSDVQRDLLAWYVYPVLLPALAALVYLAGRERDPGRRFALRGLAASALLGAAYAFSYGVYDPSSYFLAPMALALLAVVPLAAGWLARRTPAVRVRFGFAAAVLCCAMAGFWTRTGALRVEVFERFDARIHAMWDDIPFDRAIVVWGEDMHTRLVEFQLLRGEKTGLDVVVPSLLSYARGRSEFKARHGFDPMDWFAHPPPGAPIGLTPRDFNEKTAHFINERSPLPVILFDAENDSVRLLKKPAAP